TAVLKKHNIGGGYVVCYIGTVGMAHALETVVEAARKSHDDDVFFVVVGAGAAWDGLAESSRGLKNFRLIEKLEREDALDLLAAADVSLIHLMDTPVFRTVIPSKTFEAMALGKPIILGVLGEAAALVERAEAGVVVQPESPEALNEAVQRLKLSTGEAERMGANGRSYVRENHSREELARKMIRVFEDVLQPSFV
ncbi:MAG: glycosyltransferase, partial [Myxococcales bacterium]|nr:glycosyltransferase [Myxococcales bacterium]